MTGSSLKFYVKIIAGRRSGWLTGRKPPKGILSSRKILMRLTWSFSWTICSTNSHAPERRLKSWIDEIALIRRQKNEAGIGALPIRAAGVSFFTPPAFQPFQHEEYN